MGEINSPQPVLLIAAVTSRNDDALQWTIQKAIEQWGELAFVSPVFDFTETSFYHDSMGSELKKQFIAVEKLFDPGDIAGTKHVSNAWESAYARESSHAESRPLNIDPGYISGAKLVLVTTKNRDHRIYLQQGIYAEVTLHFHRKQWVSSRWTYPDYKRTDFQEFFSRCRTHLRQRIRESPK